MLAGKDGSGKSSALVSLAWYVEQTDPSATFYVIDTENKFRSALMAFGPEVPKNILYYKTDDMNQANMAVAQVVKEHKPGDWLAVESMSRLWERSQDLAYNAVAGVSKIEYLEARGRKGPPIPQPDQFWQIAKGAHDGAFFDLLTQQEDLNVIVTTTISRPPKEGFIKENADRKSIRVELGIDANLEGAPRLPYYVETLGLLEVQGGRVKCRMLRDNLSTLDDPRTEFEVPSKRDFGSMFFINCRSK